MKMNFSHLIYFHSVDLRQLLAFRRIYRNLRKLWKRQKNNYQESQFKLTDIKTFREIADLENGEAELGWPWKFLMLYMLL